MAFESLPGIKINDPAIKRTYIVADFFSVYENHEHEDLESSFPEIYQWSDFSTIYETKTSFVFRSTNSNGRLDKEFVISSELVYDPRIWLRIRAIVEGAIAANPEIEYSFGKRVLPPKILCSGCEVPSEAYVATGIYDEWEINNSNVVLMNPILDKLIWMFGPLALITAFILQVIYFGEFWNTSALLTYLVISILFGGVIGISAYLFSAYGARTLYKKLVKEDPAIFEEITFVVCEEGFMSSESCVYDFSDIIQWHKAAYFMETNHMYIIFADSKAIFWLPKRLFPKEVHQELSDFITDRILHKPIEKEETEKAEKPDKSRENSLSKLNEEPSQA
ncbi:MAG: hypothetical protein FWF76_02565 [Oscillospiraceae bacterium]|nr:hypothetical protein [Oscillospiraceae bacterium]